MVVGVFCSRSDQFNRVFVLFTHWKVCIHLSSLLSLSLFTIPNPNSSLSWRLTHFSFFSLHLSNFIILHRSLIFILILLFHLQILYYRHVILLYSEFVTTLLDPFSTILLLFLTFYILVHTIKFVSLWIFFFVEKVFLLVSLQEC